MKIDVEGKLKLEQLDQWDQFEKVEPGELCREVVPKYCSNYEVFYSDEPLWTASFRVITRTLMMPMAFQCSDGTIVRLVRSPRMQANREFV